MNTDTVPVEESDEVKNKREAWQKMVDENELQGFYGKHKAPPPTGIIFHYDTKEIRNR